MRFDYRKIVAQILSVILLIHFLIAILVLCGSCRTIRESEKEYIYNTDTLYNSVLVRDSIYVMDSTVIREKGDTVFSDRWHTKYIERLRTDTLYKSRVDSVMVEVVRQKEISRLERIRIFLVDGLISLAFVGVMALLWWLYRKFGRH